MSKKVDYQRLRGAAKLSRDRLAPHRDSRKKFIREYTGSNFGNDSSYGGDEEVPLGYVELAVSVYTQRLISEMPKAYVQTRNRDLKVEGARLKATLNYLSKMTHLQDAIEDVVLDAMFGWGVAKCGLTEPTPNEQGNWWKGAGQPYISSVSPQDWVHDMTARKWKAVGFMGNRFRIPFEEAKNADYYDKRARKMLVPTVKDSYENDQADDDPSPPGVSDGEQEEYEDMIELWELWLPREKKLVTLSFENDSIPPLREVDMSDGRNPFHMLGFQKVPDCVMPLPPVAIWYDLHQFANSLYIKLEDQAERQKNLVHVRGGDSELGQVIRDEQDGGVIVSDGEANEIRYGGADQGNFALFMHLDEMINKFQGNPKSLGGLDVGADTVGQEEMMGANAGQRLVFMGARVDGFITGVFESFTDYLYEDPLVDLEVDRPIEGTDRVISLPWNRDVIEGSPTDFEITIEPFSTQKRTPQVQSAKLQKIVAEIILPMLPILEQQGVQFNVGAMLAHLAELENLPELNDVLTFLPGGPTDPNVQQAGQERPGGMPGNTTRTYRRENVSRGSDKQKATALFQQLVGGGATPQDAGKAMGG